MPSIQKIVLALTFVASALAAQISDGQIQQPTTVVTPVVASITPVKQISDGQIQQVASTAVKVTPTPVISVTPVRQISDGQIQQPSATPIVPVNTTRIVTPSAPAVSPSVSAFKGAGSLMSYSQDLIVGAIGAAAVFALL